MKLSFGIVVLIVMTCACAKKEYATAQSNNITIKYTESGEDFPNPERGFYRYTQTKASAFQGLSLNQLNSWKGAVQAEGGHYKVYSTLIFRYYELDDFKEKPLSTAFLEAIKTDFLIARQAGFKLIPRFTYSLSPKPGPCPEGFICPPYGDAPKNIVLQHIGQLKNVLEENADVIAAVQMGFIGMWGEQYYTDYFGDASQNTPVKKLLDSNWQDRIDVLKAFLEAVPKDRMIQVRYPQIKQRYVYGIKAVVTSSPLNDSEAFSETDKARIGFHNDCFLASADDYGTYQDYGNSTTPRTDANTVLRAYKKSDSKYVAVGGETCDDAFSPQNDCEPAGKAQTEMREMHFSFLNCAYNNAVNDDWQSGGCMEEIKKSLGYRFVLKDGQFQKAAESGQPFSFSLNVENKGYASPYNKRPVKLVFRNRNNGKEYSIILNTDVRKWFPGSAIVADKVILPADMVKGSYDLFLFFPDHFASIAGRPEYAVRLANTNMWEETTGYNNLNVLLEVK
jgi:hypothetical protein